ncbi:hypothetical protein C8Q74DRAFT_1221745 [Fomes fomentarius]|nr:hypothetical protein C8Q74DRAFT_1221745 [Fomes fomentarius]
MSEQSPKYKVSSPKCLLAAYRGQEIRAWALTLRHQAGEQALPVSMMHCCRLPTTRDAAYGAGLRLKHLDAEQGRRIVCSCCSAAFGALWLWSMWPRGVIAQDDEIGAHNSSRSFDENGSGFRPPRRESCELSSCCGSGTAARTSA